MASEIVIRLLGDSPLGGDSVTDRRRSQGGGGSDPFADAVKSLKRIIAEHPEIQDGDRIVDQMISDLDRMKGKSMGKDGEGPEPKQSSLADRPLRRAESIR